MTPTSRPSVKQTLKNIADPRNPEGGWVLPHLALIAGLGKALAVALLALGIYGGLALEAHGGFTHQQKVNAPVVRVFSGGALPAHWSLGQYTVRIHQQDVSNSCLSQTAATMAEIDTRERGLSTPFSSGFLWRLATASDSPTTFNQIFNAWAWNGIAPLRAYGSDGQYPGPYPGGHAFAAASPYRISNWAQILPGDTYTMESEIHAGRPIAIAIPVYSSLLSNTGQTVYGEWGAFQFWHVVTGLGYNATGVVIQNSWGARFGTNGRVTFAWSFLRNYGAQIVVANPIGTWPHAKHRKHAKRRMPFPLKAWRSYTSAHHLANQPYRRHGRLTHTAWSWWHDKGLKSRMGVPTHQEQWLPRFHVEKLAFTHGLEYHWPSRHGDPVRFIHTKGR